MFNFSLAIPTRMHFGKGMADKLGAEILPYTKKVLMVYGGGSVKRNGAYDDTCKALKDHGIEWVELSGVQSNPKIESVYEGIRLCRENGLGAVVAVGGGSSIDASKAIAANVNNPGDAWEAIEAGKVVTDDVLPIFAVLTLAATGSEMNPSAVISNMSVNKKVGFSNEKLIPTAAIMDPTYSFSVNAFYTAAGVVDIMSHTFETYFTKEDGCPQNRMAEGAIISCIEQGPIAVKEPENYEARASLMYVSPWVINGITRSGKGVGWTCHPIEHEISAYYDVCHGAGLAVVTPAWMRYILSDETVDKFCEYAHYVWGIDVENGDKFAAANAAIDKTAEFFKSIGMPATLRELGVPNKDKLHEMAYNLDTKLQRSYVALNGADVEKILEACY